MNYQILKWPSFTVLGIAHPLKTASAFEEVPKLWDEAWRNGTMECFLEVLPDYRPAGFLGIAAGGQWGANENMNYVIGITSHIDDVNCKKVIVEGMQEFPFPEATWVVVEANGQLPAAVQSVYKQFYTQWLPNSGFVLADLPVIECYMQNQRQEVWFAIKDN